MPGDSKPCPRCPAVAAPSRSVPTDAGAAHRCANHCLAIASRRPAHPCRSISLLRHAFACPCFSTQFRRVAPRVFAQPCQSGAVPGGSVLCLCNAAPHGSSSGLAFASDSISVASPSLSGALRILVCRCLRGAPLRFALPYPCVTLLLLAMPLQSISALCRT